MIHCDSSGTQTRRTPLIKKNMINKIVRAIQPVWVCEPFDWLDAGPAARVKVHAWTANDARMKAYDLLQCENIVVRRYEE